MSAEGFTKNAAFTRRQICALVKEPFFKFVIIIRVLQHLTFPVVLVTKADFSVASVFVCRRINNITLQFLSKDFTHAKETVLC